MLETVERLIMLVVFAIFAVWAVANVVPRVGGALGERMIRAASVK